MKSAVAYHGLLQMVIAHSGPGFTVRVIDPCENRYVLLTSPASTLEEVEQLGIAAIALERNSDEMTIRKELARREPLHSWKPISAPVVLSHE